MTFVCWIPSGSPGSAEDGTLLQSWINVLSDAFRHAVHQRFYQGTMFCSAELRNATHHKMWLRRRLPHSGFGEWPRDSEAWPSLDGSPEFTRQAWIELQPSEYVLDPRRFA